MLKSIWKFIVALLLNNVLICKQETKHYRYIPGYITFELYTVEMYSVRFPRLRLLLGHVVYILGAVDQKNNFRFEYIPWRLKPDSIVHGYNAFDYPAEETASIDWDDLYRQMESINIVYKETRHSKEGGE